MDKSSDKQDFTIEIEELDIKDPNQYKSVSHNSEMNKIHMPDNLIYTSSDLTQSDKEELFIAVNNNEGDSWINVQQNIPESTDLKFIEVENPILPNEEKVLGEEILNKTIINQLDKDIVHSDENVCTNIAMDEICPNKKCYNSVMSIEMDSLKDSVTESQNKNIEDQNEEQKYATEESEIDSSENEITNSKEENKDEFLYSEIHELTHKRSQKEETEESVHDFQIDNKENIDLKVIHTDDEVAGINKYISNKDENEKIMTNDIKPIINTNLDEITIVQKIVSEIIKPVDELIIPLEKEVEVLSSNTPMKMTDINKEDLIHVSSKYTINNLYGEEYKKLIVDDPVDKESEEQNKQLDDQLNEISIDTHKVQCEELILDSTIKKDNEVFNETLIFDSLLGDTTIKHNNEKEALILDFPVTYKDEVEKLESRLDSPSDVINSSNNNEESINNSLECVVAINTLGVENVSILDSSIEKQLIILNENDDSLIQKSMIDLSLNDCTVKEKDEKKELVINCRSDEITFINKEKEELMLHSPTEIVTNSKNEKELINNSKYEVTDNLCILDELIIESPMEKEGIIIIKDVQSFKTHQVESVSILDSPLEDPTIKQEKDKKEILILDVQTAEITSKSLDKIEVNCDYTTNDVINSNNEKSSISNSSNCVIDIKTCEVKDKESGCISKMEKDITSIEDSESLNKKSTLDSALDHAAVKIQTNEKEQPILDSCIVEMGIDEKYEPIIKPTLNIVNIEQKDQKEPIDDFSAGEVTCLSMEEEEKSLVEKVINTKKQKNETLTESLKDDLVSNLKEKSLKDIHLNKIYNNTLDPLNQTKKEYKKVTFAPDVNDNEKQSIVILNYEQSISDLKSALSATNEDFQFINKQKPLECTHVILETDPVLPINELNINIEIDLNEKDKLNVTDINSQEVKEDDKIKNDLEVTIVQSDTKIIEKEYSTDHSNNEIATSANIDIKHIKKSIDKNNLKDKIVDQIKEHISKNKIDSNILNKNEFNVHSENKDILHENKDFTNNNKKICVLKTDLTKTCNQVSSKYDTNTKSKNFSSNFSSEHKNISQKYKDNKQVSRNNLYRDPLDSVESRNNCTHVTSRDNFKKNSYFKNNTSDKYKQDKYTPYCDKYNNRKRLDFEQNRTPCTGKTSNNFNKWHPKNNESVTNFKDKYQQNEKVNNDKILNTAVRDDPISLQNTEENSRLKVDSSNRYIDIRNKLRKPQLTFTLEDTLRAKEASELQDNTISVKYDNEEFNNNPIVYRDRQVLYDSLSTFISNSREESTVLPSNITPNNSNTTWVQNYYPGYPSNFVPNMHQFSLNELQINPTQMHFTDPHQRSYPINSSTYVYEMTEFGSLNIPQQKVVQGGNIAMTEARSMNTRCQSLPPFIQGRGQPTSDGMYPPRELYMDQAQMSSQSSNFYQLPAQMTCYHVGSTEGQKYSPTYHDRFRPNPNVPQIFRRVSKLDSSPSDYEIDEPIGCTNLPIISPKNCMADVAGPPLQFVVPNYDRSTSKPGSKNQEILNKRDGFARGRRIYTNKSTTRKFSTQK